MTAKFTEAAVKQESVRSRSDIVSVSPCGWFVLSIQLYHFWGFYAIFFPDSCPSLLDFQVI